MSRFEDEFDRDVRSALQGKAADETFSEEMTISQLQSMVFANLRGKSRWLTVVSFGKMLAFIGGAIFAAVRFFQVEGVQAWIGYSALFSVCTLGVAMISITYWSFMTRNSLAKAIKQLEVRVAHMSEQMNKSEAA